MIPQEILNLRLSNQILLHKKFKEPAEVIMHMCAMQAQDFLGSLWAVGLRTESCTETDIEKAIANRSIVRTWPMRGTLHYVVPQDIRWMLKLMTPRILKLNAKRLKRDYDLDEAVYLQSRKILEKALQGNKQLERNNVYKVLEEEGIPATGQRGLHIIGYLAHQGILCFGERMGKQPSFVLLDEWIPQSRELSHEESLAEIALRYFTSRGPATLADFIWWTGLTSTAAKQAVELVKTSLVSESFQDETYWMSPSIQSASLTDEILLLPPFDEYLIAYANRSLMLGDYTMKDIVPFSNGMFFPVIIEKGKLIGTWKRTIQKKSVNIELKTFIPLNKSQHDKIERTKETYRKFLSKE
jgi:hypothetical protein